MRAFRHRHHRSAPRCSYCGSRDHRINKCPIVEKDWALISNGRMPLESPVPSWYKSGPNWGSWYVAAQKGASKVTAARERANNKRPTTTRPRKCGFCGQAGHTRRNCELKASFISLCQKANANWRQAAYEKIVGECGIYVGGLIKARTAFRNRNTPQREAIGIITSVNFGELNVMTGYGHLRNYVQPLRIEAVFNGKKRKVQLSRPSCDETVNSASFEWGFNTVTFLEKMTSKTVPLDENWMTDFSDGWEWLVRSKSLQQIKDAQIYEHIQSWASKTP